LTPLVNDEQSNIKNLGKGIRIGHLNVIDILSKNKKDEIKVMLDSYNYDIFAITETWLWKEMDTRSEY